MKNKEADVEEDSRLCLVSGSERDVTKRKMCFGVSGSRGSLNPKQSVPVTQGL